MKKSVSRPPEFFSPVRRFNNFGQNMKKAAEPNYVSGSRNFLLLLLSQLNKMSLHKNVFVSLILLVNSSAATFNNFFLSSRDFRAFVAAGQ